MKSLSLLLFLMLSFTANANLSRIQCELANGDKILAFKMELAAPYKASAVILNADNSVVVDKVDTDEPGQSRTSYAAFGDMRLDISLEEDGGQYDVWLLVDGREDEITHEQVGFNLNDEPFTIETRKVNGANWSCTVD